MSATLSPLRPVAVLFLRLLVLVTVLSATVPARGDGPHIAFHGTDGSYTVTLFSAPDPLVAGPADLTLLVQNAVDGSLVDSDAVRASGQLSMTGHAPVRFDFRPGAVTNPRLLGATVLLGSGSYSLTLQVASRVRNTNGSLASGIASGVSASFAGTLPVEANHGQRNTVLFSVFLTVMIVALFLINQYAKQKARSRRRQFTSSL